MKEKEIRLLRADEVECRVGIINEKGASLLLYKAARADMKILDETYGSLNWQRTHQSIDNDLYCTVQIWDEEKNQWICKQDVGTPNKAEKEKARASDSFKRACFSVGVGRELYSAPFIWISARKCEIKKKETGFYTDDKFRVQEISYNKDREINGLSIINQDGVIVYQMKNIKSIGKRGSNRELSIGQIMEFTRELDRTGVNIDTVLKRYKLSTVEDMTQDVFKSAMNSLRKTGVKAA